MLDRIDANIETTKINYQKGNKQLVSVKIIINRNFLQI